MRRWLVGVGLLPLAAAAGAPYSCGGSRDGRGGQAPPDPAGPAFVTLEREGCDFPSLTCPAYRVTLTAAGAMHFTPRGPFPPLRPRGVRGDASLAAALLQAHTRVRVVPPAVVDALVARLEAEGLFGLADRYDQSAPGCGPSVSCQSTAVLRVRSAGRVKVVRHYAGCLEAPPELARLEALVDSAAGVGRWVPAPRTR